MDHETKTTTITPPRCAAALAVFLILFLAPRIPRAAAATLFLSPASGNESVGQSFTVSVMVSSADQAMNAAQGTISFPTGKLNVVSLSRTNSVMTLWVQPPSFSNKDGVVNFQGVAVNPGFEGAAGNILTITFVAKGAGSAPLTFTSGAILANDGKGTNILDGMQGAAFTLKAAAAGAAAGAPTTKTGTPPVPLAVSVPATSDGSWYNINTIQYRWNIPADITGVSYGLATSSDYALPEINGASSSQISYDLSKIPDGKWYFLLSVKYGGAWSVPAIKPLWLDRTPPEAFDITSVDDASLNGNPAFIWSTTDAASGISHYEAQIGNGDWFDPASIRQGDMYVLPPQSPTDARIFTVRAYDNAGNVRESSIAFRVPTGGCAPICFVPSFAFLSNHVWAYAIVAAILLVIAYLLIYDLILWRRKLKIELHEFKKELRRDLARLEGHLGEKEGKGSKLDLRPAHLDARREAIEKEAARVEGDIEQELKKLGDE